MIDGTVWCRVRVRCRISLSLGSRDGSSDGRPNHDGEDCEFQLHCEEDEGESVLRGVCLVKLAATANDHFVEGNRAI